MLKYLIANKKKVPVPIPLMTLREAILWVESVLIIKDHTITRIDLDGKEIDYNLAVEGGPGKTQLTEQSKVEVKIDSPLELTIQTIDALRNMAMVMKRSLKMMAVTSWQTEPKETPAEVHVLVEDLDLMLSLMDHIYVLIKSSIKVSVFDDVASAIEKIKITIEMAIANSDWQGLARILLRQLEPKLVEMNDTLNLVESTVFEHQAALRDKNRKEMQLASR